LGADRLGKQRIAVAHLRRAVDPQPLRLVVHGDEQQADVRIGEDVAKALEHAVAVVIGKGKLVVAGHAYKARHPAFERAIRLALSVCGGEKEVRAAFDVGLVVRRERCPRQLFFQPVGNAPAVEAVL
jgi:hypothetical protein